MRVCSCGKCGNPLPLEVHKRTAVFVCTCSLLSHCYIIIQLRLFVSLCETGFVHVTSISCITKSYKYATICAIIILVCLSLSYHMVRHLRTGIFLEDKHKVGGKQKYISSLNVNKSSSPTNVTEIVSLIFAVMYFTSTTVSGLDTSANNSFADEQEIYHDAKFCGSRSSCFLEIPIFLQRASMVALQALY